MNLFLLQVPNSVLGTKIVLNKQSDLILHGAEIVAPTGIVEADIDGLVSHFTQIEQALSDSGSQLNSGIDNEASIRLAADQSLAADLSTEKGRIDVILDGSTVDLDQFREIVDFVQSIDIENDETLLNAVVNINQSIDNVMNDYQSADNDILDQLSSLTIYTDNQLNIVTSGLDQEIQDRTDAVQGVQDDLNNYKDYTDTAIINLQSNINMGDESLATLLSSEESSRISGDESLATLLTNSLDQNYSQLSSDISAEVSRATSAEDSLATTIANVISNADPAALDSLVEVVNAFQSADGDINGAIQALAGSLSSDLSTEVSRAESAELSLDDAKLDLAGGTMLGGIDMGGNNIGGINEIYTNYIETDRVQSINGGAISIESNIDMNSYTISNLGALYTANIIAKDGMDWIIVGSDLNLGNRKIITLGAPTNDSDAANKLYVDSASVSLESALSSEISRAEAAEDSLEVALSTEVSYLISNTDFSKLDSFSETIDATNAVISTTYDSAVEYVVSNRPTMVGFTSTPDGTTTTFDSVVEFGTHIVFLNGLMQLEGVDFTIQSVSGGSQVTFTSAPFVGDAINIYGVPFGTQADPFGPIQ